LVAIYVTVYHTLRLRILRSLAHCLDYARSAYVYIPPHTFVYAFTVTTFAVGLLLVTHLRLHAFVTHTHVRLPFLHVAVTFGCCLRLVYVCWLHGYTFCPLLQLRLFCYRFSHPFRYIVGSPVRLPYTHVYGYVLVTRLLVRVAFRLDYCGYGLHVYVVHYVLVVCGYTRLHTRLRVCTSWLTRTRLPHTTPARFRVTVPFAGCVRCWLRCCLRFRTFCCPAHTQLRTRLPLPRLRVPVLPHVGWLRLHTGSLRVTVTLRLVDWLPVTPVTVFHTGYYRWFTHVYTRTHVWFHTFILPAGLPHTTVGWFTVTLVWFTVWFCRYHHLQFGSARVWLLRLRCRLVGLRLHCGSRLRLRFTHVSAPRLRHILLLLIVVSCC